MAVGLLMLSSCGFGGMADMLRTAPRSCENKDGVTLSFFTISPDGETVAFNYRGPRSAGVGLLKWRTGQLTRANNAGGNPGWSYDGRKLIGVRRYSGKEATITVLDLETGQVTDMMEKRVGRPKSIIFPVFQPGTGKILYVAEKSPTENYLVLFDPADGSETTILALEDGFATIFRPWFVGRDEIIFEAIFPRNDIVKKRVSDTVDYVQVAYRLKFGELSEVFRPDIQDKFNLMNSISASKDGRMAVYIGVSLSTPYTGSLYNLEIIKIENGLRTQLTDLRNYSAFASVAYDGSAVAFGSNPARTKCVDLYVLDTKTGKVVQTGLLSRLETDPAFQGVMKRGDR